MYMHCRAWDDIHTAVVVADVETCIVGVFFLLRLKRTVYPAYPREKRKLLPVTRVGRRGDRLESGRARPNDSISS